METLKISIIKNDKQYNRYCKRVEELLESRSKNKSSDDEIELLELLIEKYDRENNSLDLEMDPIRLLKSFMEEAEMKATGLAQMLNVSKGLVSDILNYKKGLSKDIIRKLAERFKVQQDAFNRPYPLKNPASTRKEKSTIESIRAKYKNYSAPMEKSRYVAAKEPAGKYTERAVRKKGK